LSHARTFGLLRTHLLCESELTGSVEKDRRTLLRALGAGAAWLTCPFVAPAHGARFWAERASGAPLAMGAEARAGSASLHLSLPRPAEIVVLRDGVPIHKANAAALDLRIHEPGAYRVEARIDRRLWLLSNPIHLR
jgi:hypothetical protein